MSDLEEMAGARADAPAVPDRMTGQQKLALAVLLGAQFMLAADFSILTVSLPVIGDSLGFSLDHLQWITTGFALPAAGFTLLFGRIADLFGRRKVFLLGIVLLAAASLVGGLAQSSEVLLAARVAQGVATAISVPSALALLTTTFPEGPLRRKALGLNGALLGGGFSAGALLGGLLTELFSWRWSFLINVPIALFVLIGTLLVIPEGRAAVRSRLDVPGAATVTAGMLALVFGITTAGEQGWAHAEVYLWLAAAVVLLVTFWFVELKSANPLVPVRVLKRRTVRWGNFGGFASIAMTTATSFSTTLYMQKVLDFPALTTGVVIGLPGLLTVLGGTIAPRLLGRIGAPAVLALSLVVQCVGYGVLLLLGGGATTGVVLVLVALSVGFFGHAYSLVSYMVSATSGLPDDEQGLATGLTTMSMQIAITLGIPVISAVIAARTSSLSQESPTDAMLGGLHAGVLVLSVFLLVSALIVWLFLGRGRADQEARA
ncbi:MFS transporter [Streptomyces sp. A0958]|uniref:MFS transporter n=1 Tax=Streptomyces sp. A0958 TaxID=2563101 RepID=UPI0019D2B803|nr:MFS transporter [Streptomyces sp. A0958]